MPAEVIVFVFSVLKFLIHSALISFLTLFALVHDEYLSILNVCYEFLMY